MSACIGGKNIPGRGNSKYRKPGNKSVSLECVRNGTGAGMQQEGSKDYKNDAGEVPWSQTGKARVNTWYGKLKLGTADSLQPGLYPTTLTLHLDNFSPRTQSSSMACCGSSTFWDLYHQDPRSPMPGLPPGTKDIRILSLITDLDTPWREKNTVLLINKRQNDSSTQAIAHLLVKFPARVGAVSNVNTNGHFSKGDFFYF